MKNEEKNPKKEPILKRLKPFAGRRIYLMGISAAFAILSAVFLVMPYYFLWKIVDEALDARPDYGAADIIGNAWMALMFLVFAIVCMFVALMFSHLCAFRTQKNVKKFCIEHAMTLPPGSFATEGVGSMRRTIDDCADSIHGFLADQFPDLTRSRVLPAIVLVMLFLFDWRLGVAVLAPVAITIVIIMSMMSNKAIEASMREFMTAQTRVSSAAVEYIRGVSVLKAFQQTIGSFKNFSSAVEEYHEYVIGYTKKMRRRMIPAYLVIDSIFAFIMAVVFYEMDGRVVSNRFLADFLFYLIFTPVVTVLFNKIMFTTDLMYRAHDALDRVDALLAMKPLEEPAEPKEPQGSDIVFENVTFTYDGADGPAVKDFSLRIEAGKVVALVGASGSGKSTVASLACRFMDPTSGRITLGGVDLRNVGDANIRKAESCVFQTNHLMKGTVAYNVRLGRPDATDGEVTSALRAAQCDDLLAKLPDGLDTVIGPGGVYLSGGETQRVAIARAILRDAPVVIMDEATAFADPENEHLVQKAFEELAKDKAVLIVAHRLTTVRNADLICVMDGGRIVESGTHDELLGGNNRYADMWNDYQKSLSWKVKGVPQ